MPRTGRRDANQKSIVEALRAAGVTVIEMGGVGDGVPDLHCYRRSHGLMRWLEIKMPGGKLTPAQEKFHALVPVWVVYSVADALRAMELEVAT
jgi:hypothetical protein